MSRSQRTDRQLGAAEDNGPPNDDCARLTRDQWLHLYCAIQDQDDDEALDTLLRIRPATWPDPEDLLDELPANAHPHRGPPSDRGELGVGGASASERADP